MVTQVVLKSVVFSVVFISILQTDFSFEKKMCFGGFFFFVFFVTLPVSFLHITFFSQISSRK